MLLNEVKKVGAVKMNQMPRSLNDTMTNEKKHINVTTHQFCWEMWLLSGNLVHYLLRPLHCILALSFVIFLLVGLLLLCLRGCGILGQFSSIEQEE